MRIFFTKRKPADDVVRTKRERHRRVLKPIVVIEIRPHCPSISVFVEINKIAESFFFACFEFVNCLVYFIEDSDSILNAASASGKVEAVVQHVAAIAPQFLARGRTCDFIKLFPAANAFWIIEASTSFFPGNKCRTRPCHFAVTKNIRLVWRSRSIIYDAIFPVELFRVLGRLPTNKSRETQVFKSIISFEVSVVHSSLVGLSSS